MARNWAGTYEYRAPQLAPAATADDVRRLVAGSGPVHALGTRHSFTDLPDTAGTLVDVSPMSGVLGIDDAAATATVAAGTRYGVLAGHLEARGWALPNLGSLPHIGVAGATQTGTHGSGDGNGVLSTSVRSLRYVGADGEVHEVRRDEPDFPALAVGLGAFGVVVDVTLDLVPSYRVRQDVYSGVSWDAALDDYDAITSAGYSVSVFTRWDGPDVGYVWVKTRLDADDDAVPETLLDGALAVDDSPLGSGDNITELGGIPGPWMLRLPHFRLDREPSFGEEIQTEYFVPRAAATGALAAVRALSGLVRPHLVWSELRTAAADDLWLSGAYGQHVVIMHFTWFDHPADVARIVPQLERALEPFGARPHWGKVHGFDAASLSPVHPRLDDARAVYERLDPDGRFVNDHLRRIGVRD